MKANQKFKNDNSGYARVVGGIVGLLITIIVGILVYWSISPSIEFDSDDANDSRNETDNVAGTVFTLLPILGIVVIGGIMIGAVMSFGGGSKR